MMIAKEKNERTLPLNDLSLIESSYKFLVLQTEGFKLSETVEDNNGDSILFFRKENQ
ncbi:MAG: hypothetical protein PHC62_00470 [Candidatus Izemoplasmatales bacterium]|nr:hypothetical protein [Candidatus Izemoplasmatales bacterium]